MGKIFVIMGKSSSGKDTIYTALKEDTSLGLKTIVGYTTRPMRSGEKDGVTYFFVSEEERAQMETAGKVIECRTYPTVHGPWSYFTADDGQVDDENGCDCLYIGTLESFAALRAYYGAERVLPIYIEVDGGIRLERALKRERMQEHPRYAELCRRYLADEEDFSEEKKQALGLSECFYNNGAPAECLAAVKEFILQEKTPV